MTEFKTALTAFLTAEGIPFTLSMVETAAAYAAYLKEENEKLNLTAITGEREMAIKHFGDSLLPLSRGDLPLGSSFIDVGTGAGFPGLVWKIFRPDLQVTLLDSLKKRCAFLERLTVRLGLTDVTVVWGRAEEAGHNPELREKFDFATARAVAAMPILLEYATPFVKPGGVFFALKGREEEEGSAPNACAELSSVIEDVYHYDLDGESRTLITVGKTGSTKAKYPRRPGMAKKRPL